MRLNIKQTRSRKPTKQGTEYKRLQHQHKSPTLHFKMLQPDCQITFSCNRSHTSDHTSLGKHSYHTPISLTDSLFSPNPQLVLVLVCGFASRFAHFVHFFLCGLNVLVFCFLCIFSNSHSLVGCRSGLQLEANEPA